jgi:hypothetical protein
MAEDSAYRRMLEGKISSKKYAKELKKQVRRARHSNGRSGSTRTPNSGRRSASG